MIRGSSNAASFCASRSRKLPRQFRRKLRAALNTVGALKSSGRPSLPRLRGGRHRRRGRGRGTRCRRASRSPKAGRSPKSFAPRATFAASRSCGAAIAAIGSASSRHRRRRGGPATTAAQRQATAAAAPTARRAPTGLVRQAAGAMGPSDGSVIPRLLPRGTMARWANVPTSDGLCRPSAEHQRQSMLEKHILVVDDDAAMRDIIGAFLTERDFRVSSAADGKEMARVLARDPRRPDHPRRQAGARRRARADALAAGGDARRRSSS